MGVVWEAVHVVTRKVVALKFLKRTTSEDPRAVQRFLREARAACAVRHPNVVEVHDVLELPDGSPVMVMDLLRGETLAKKLEREGAMPLPELATIAAHVCSAVGSAHALGIVHRDLKPENIFLAQVHDSLVVKVLDFGIAKLTASEGDAAHSGAPTGTGAILGTPYYMAPEQLFGEKDIDHRADIWALGIILYEALAGARPTQAANVGQVYKLVMVDGITPLEGRALDIPAPVVDLVSRMLSRDKRRRPSDMREVLAVLSNYTLEAVPPVAPPGQTLQRGGEGAGEHGPVGNVDSDTAHAATLNALASGRNVWRVAAVLGFVSAAGVVGVVALRGGPIAAPPSAPASTAPAVSVPVVAASPVPEATSAPAGQTSAPATTVPASAASAARVPSPRSPVAAPRPKPSASSAPIREPGSYL